MSEKIKKTVKVRIWNKYFILLMVINFFTAVCNQFFNPTLSLHATELGANTTEVGLLGTSLTLGAAVFRIVSGKVSDKKGRMKTAFIGAVIFCISSAMFLFADSIAVILVLRVIQGIGFGLTSTALTASCADCLPSDGMSAGIGYYGLANSLAQTVGPSCAVALYYTHYGFKAVAAVSAFSLALAAAMTFACKFEQDHDFLDAVAATRPVKKEEVLLQPEEYTGIWKYFEKTAVPCGIVMLFCCLATGVVTGFTVLYAKTEGIALENAGLFFTISAIGVVFSRLGTGTIMKKFGTLFAMIVSFVCGILTFILLIAARNIHILFFVAGAMNGICSGLYNPTLNAEAMFRAPANRRGAASATFMVPVEVGFALSSLLAGIIIGFSNYIVSWVICIAYDVIGLILSVIFFRNAEKH